MAKADKNETAERASKREYIDATGAPQKTKLNAAGVRYTVQSSGYAHDMPFADLPPEIRAAALGFGLLTLAGNVTNTARNGEEGKALSDEDRAAAEKEQLVAWWDNLTAGNWSLGRDTEVGLATLAEAFARVKTAAGKPESAETLLEKLKAATPEAIESYRANAKIQMAVTEINAERAMARKAKAAQAAVVPDL